MTTGIAISLPFGHATTSHCGGDSVSKAHSDQNQAPWSVERRGGPYAAHGDNMVVAWIAVDPWWCGWYQKVPPMWLEGSS